MKHYIITKAQYEYNDEIYTELEYGRPMLSTTDKKTALDKAVELSIEEFRTMLNPNELRYSMDLRELFYDYTEITDFESLNDAISPLSLIKQNVKYNFDEWENIIKQLRSMTLTDEHVKNLIRALDLNLFDVIEVDEL